MEIEYTQTKSIVGELGKPRIEITPILAPLKPASLGYTATVIFPVSGGDSLILNYGFDEWNNFWNSFNSGKFLVEELKRKYNLDSLVIPTDIETWFINVI